MLCISNRLVLTKGLIIYYWLCILLALDKLLARYIIMISMYTYGEANDAHLEAK